MTSVIERPASWWAPALRHTERGQAGVPEWVRLAEQAFAAAGAQPRVIPVADTGTERGAAEAHFAPVVAPFVAVAVEPLRALTGAGRDVAPELMDGVAAELTAALTRTAARCLVAEVHRVLAGEGTAEDFQAVVAATATPAGLRSLAARYPVLVRLLASQAASRIAATCEVLDRLRADRAALIAGLLDGCDPGRLSGIQAGVGDTHRQGRSVCILHFDSGARLVYKPRPLAVHAAVERVLAVLCSASKDRALAFRSARVLDRASYGWMEFLRPEDCTGAAGVADFYRRQGALLAVLYALRATDMHCENLLACADFPVLLDLETVLHPDLAAPTEAGDPARRGLDQSVLRTAMLPRHGAGPELSGFGGAVAMTPDSIRWVGAGTPGMHLQRGDVSYPGAANNPRLAGRAIGAGDYVDEIAAGFRSGYDALVRVADELLAAGGPIEELCDLASRVVLRNTKLYARLLDECTHPDVLADALAREQVLRALAEHGCRTDAQLIACEVDQLWLGDVPMFESRPGSAHLWAVDGSDPVVRDAATAPHGAEVRALLARLSTADRERQVWILKAALLAAHGAAATDRSVARLEADHLGSPRSGDTASAAAERLDPAAEPADLLTAAMVIGDRLIGEAFDDGSRCNWLTVYRHPDGTTSLLPMGADLGNGYLGVSLFLAQLAEVGGAGRHRDCARRTLADVGNRIDVLAADPAYAGMVGAGAFHGLGGLVYALHQVRELDPAAVSPHAVSAAITLLDRTADSADLTVATGRSGGLLALLTLAAAGYDGAAERAEKWADTIAASQDHPAEPGLFAGRLGLILALARAGKQLQRPGLQRQAAELLSLLPPNRIHGVGIAEGLGGLALVHDEVDPGSFTARQLHRRLAELAGTAGDDSPATGWFGLAGVLADRPDGLPLGQVADRVDRLARATTLGRPLARCAVPAGLVIPGLLHGLAGIGHGLLQLHDPASVPAVLTLRPRDRHPVGTYPNRLDSSTLFHPNPLQSRGISS